MKRDKSVQFMKKKSEATSGPQAFVSGHFYSMTYHAPSVGNDTAWRCFTLCQKCTRFFFVMCSCYWPGRPELLSQPALAVIVSERRAALGQKDQDPDVMTRCLIIEPV